MEQKSCGSLTLLFVTKIYNTAPPSLDKLFEKNTGCLGGLSTQSMEHLAEKQQMLTAGLTASICSLPYCSVQTIEWMGWGCFVLRR